MGGILARPFCASRSDPFPSNTVAPRLASIPPLSIRSGLQLGYLLDKSQPTDNGHLRQCFGQVSQGWLCFCHCYGYRLVGCTFFPTPLANGLSTRREQFGQCHPI